MVRSLFDQLNKAICLLAFILSRDVLASRVFSAAPVRERISSSTVWDQLGRAAKQEEKEARCSDVSKELYLNARALLLGHMTGQAAVCEDAARRGQTKCMGIVPEYSVTLMPQRARLFRAAEQKFQKCDWPQVADNSQKLNEELARSIARIYENAPEFSKLREKLDSSFADLATKVKNAMGSSRDIVTAVLKLFGSGGGGGPRFQRARVSDSKSLDDQNDTHHDSNNMWGNFVKLQPQWCWRRNDGMKSFACGFAAQKSCFRFSTADGKHKDSEEMDDETVTPEDNGRTFLHNIQLQTNVVGFAKSSPQRWGICAPQGDPQKYITEVNEIRNQIARQAEAAESRVEGQGVASLLQGETIRMDPVSLTFIILWIIAAALIFTELLLRLAESSMV